MLKCVHPLQRCSFLRHVIFFLRVSSIPPPSTLTALTYIILGGQHAVEALRRRRAELHAASLNVPDQFNEVVATILRHETPLGVRLYAAGDSQAAQSAHHPVAMEDVARLFLPRE